MSSSTDNPGGIPASPTETQRQSTTTGDIDGRPLKRLKMSDSVASSIDVPAGATVAGGDESIQKVKLKDEPQPQLPFAHSAKNKPSEPNETSQPSEPGKPNQRVNGIAPIKPEYLITQDGVAGGQTAGGDAAVDDDAAEGRADHGHRDNRDRNSGSRSHNDRRDRKKDRGQNKNRHFGNTSDELRLCVSRIHGDEFSPGRCKFGDKCKFEHDLRKYLNEGRRESLDGFLGGPCPVFDRFGKCFSGWKCRFVKSHMKEVEREDGRQELVLIAKAATATDGSQAESGAVTETGPVGEPPAVPTEMPTEAPTEVPAEVPEAKGPQELKPEEPKSGEPDSERLNTEGEEELKQVPEEGTSGDADEDDFRPDIVNMIGVQKKVALSRRKTDFAKSDEYVAWMNAEAKLAESFRDRRDQQSLEGIEDLRAQFVEPPFLPSEKRRIYFGPETPALAPLTTQGNIPFRRLCVELGAELTYSEMAMGLPLLQGAKTDWSLLRAHRTETERPKFDPAAPDRVVDGYDNSRDLRFGVQISAPVPWQAIKAANILSRYCPHLRLIDLNCGCPIDSVYKTGAGSALLAAHGKLERIVRGMNSASGDIPITVKIRTGVRGSQPTAPAIIGRLAFGGREHRERLGAPGCAAVTLHGRSREQRYTKRADWSYIAECAALVRTYNRQRNGLTDTAAEPDARTLPPAQQMYFIGNGDCYSHEDYFGNLRASGVDTVMIGRGALIKPWIFEEIEKGQYLDKSSSQRLQYVEKFARYGLEAWGSDEVGVGYTRRFLLEWMSFSHRYVPVGLLEHLPPSLNDRPPAYRGRDELETLLASPNYQDWIKISEMFLGPAHPNFQFQPKHKSNAYEAEG